MMVLVRAGDAVIGVTAGTGRDRRASGVRSGQLAYLVHSAR